MFGSRRPRVLAALCAALAIALLASCARVVSAATEDDSPAADTSGSGRKPNIVYVLTDDLAWNLVEYLPHVRQLQKKGTTFTNFFATDSLCCPSRTSLLTGQYPHNTGVFTNTGDDGGYGAFMKNRNEEKTFGPALQRAGLPHRVHGQVPQRVPAGRQERHVQALCPLRLGRVGRGRGRLQGVQVRPERERRGRALREGPQDYLTDVLAKKATSFIGSSADARKPFMLEVATFAPHGPSTPAPRDKDTFPGLEAPQTDAYDKATRNAPKWQRSLSPLTAEEKEEIDQRFAKRVRSAQAVDDMIGQLEKTLEEKGLADDTYLVFGSDNGFHMGEHRLRPGKQTAYDTDVKVPMMVTGPGVPAGEEVSRLAENVDINPTFLDLAGVEPPSTVDGRSLSDLMHGRTEEEWRQAVLVEHHHAKSKEGDPDAAPKDSGDPPTYAAMRTDDSLYVEYADGEREFYALGSDPDQLTNRAASLSPAQRAALHHTLTALQRCKGAESCQAASRTRT